MVWIKHLHPLSVTCVCKILISLRYEEKSQKGPIAFKSDTNKSSETEICHNLSWVSVITITVTLRLSAVDKTKLNPLPDSDEITFFTFASNLIYIRPSVGYDLDLNCLTVWWCSKTCLKRPLKMKTKT